MNKIVEYAKRFNVPPCMELHYKNNIEDVKEPNQALLDLIFGVDPSTGLPVGDLSYYLGEKANPEVKLFIESQLLREIPSQDGLSNLPTDVTNKFKSLSDDDVAFFTRNHDESPEEYGNRLKVYFAQEREKRASEKRQRIIDRLINGSTT